MMIIHLYKKGAVIRNFDYEISSLFTNYRILFLMMMMIDSKVPRYVDSDFSLQAERRRCKAGREKCIFSTTHLGLVMIMMEMVMPMITQSVCPNLSDSKPPGYPHISTHIHSFMRKKYIYILTFSTSKICSSYNFS